MNNLNIFLHRLRIIHLGMDKVVQILVLYHQHMEHNHQLLRYILYTMLHNLRKFGQYFPTFLMGKDNPQLVFLGNYILYIQILLHIIHKGIRT